MVSKGQFVGLDWKRITRIFQKLIWSGELSYVEGEVEVVSTDHDASDYYESQREKNSNSEMLLPQQC